MVLEQFFKITWIESKWHAFYIAFVYTLIGLVSSWIIFRSSFGLMSLAFISILLVPSLSMLLQLEENIEIRERKFSIKMLFKDHFDIIKVYIFLFFGCYVVFFLMGSFFPSEWLLSNFPVQLRAAGVTGSAISSGIYSSLFETFTSLFLNNAIVFIVAFLLSFIYGSGAILFLVWNASVWGIAFGHALNLAIVGDILSFEAQRLILSIPHTFLEGSSYLFAAIVGGVVSKAVLREEIFSKKFTHIVTDALLLLGIGIILVVIAGVIESLVIDYFFY